MKLYLDETGDYRYHDSVGGIAVVSMCRRVEERIQPASREMGCDLVEFMINVDGLKVVGHTLRDPHNRIAYEWEVAELSCNLTQEMVVESNRPPRTWRTEPVCRPRPLPPKRPWWKFW